METLKKIDAIEAYHTTRPGDKLAELAATVGAPMQSNAFAQLMQRARAPIADPSEMTPEMAAAAAQIAAAKIELGIS